MEKTLVDLDANTRTLPLGKILALGELVDIKPEKDALSSARLSTNVLDGLQSVPLPERPPELEDTGFIPDFDLSSIGSAAEETYRIPGNNKVVDQVTEVSVSINVTFRDLGSKSQELEDEKPRISDSRYSPRSSKASKRYSPMSSRASKFSYKSFASMNALIYYLFFPAEVGPAIPWRKRLNLKRFIIWCMFFMMSIFALVHCIGYLIEPDPQFPKELEDTPVEKGTLAYNKGVLNDWVRDDILMPKNYAFEAPFGIFVFAGVFGVVAVAFIVDFVWSIFFLRRAAIVQVVRRPGGFPSVKKALGWILAWITYYYSIIEPGASFYWQKMFMDEVLELFLQSLRLASFGGRDFIRGEPHPAEADQIVVFQALVICADLWLMGLVMHFRAIFASIVLEVIIDIGYTVAPFVALGSYALTPAAWYSVRNRGGDIMMTIYFLCSVIPMIKARHLLQQLDNLCLTQISRNELQASLDTPSPALDSQETQVSKTCATGTSPENEASAVAIVEPASHDVAPRVSTHSRLSELSTGSLKDQFRTLSDKFRRAAGVQGRVGGWRANVALCVRFVIGGALLTWVLSASYHPCDEQFEGDGFWCAMVTHPIFENPPCDCRVLTGSIYSPGRVFSPASFRVAEKRFEDIAAIAESVEWLFMREMPPTNYSMLPAMDRRHDWLNHAKGVAFEAIIDKNEFPLFLRAAKRLTQLQVSFMRTQELPEWFYEFEELERLSFPASRLQNFPERLMTLPNLYYVNLAASECCASPNWARSTALQKEQVGRHFRFFNCDFGGAEERLKATGPFFYNCDAAAAAETCKKFRQGPGGELAADIRLPNGTLVPGGVWNGSVFLHSHKICLNDDGADQNTECTGLCMVYLGMFNQIDAKEPKGFLDWEELNSPVSKAFFKQAGELQPFLQNIVPAFQSPEHVGCSMDWSGCQPCNSEHRNYVAFKTGGYIISAMEPEVRSNCADCVKDVVWR